MIEGVADPGNFSPLAARPLIPLSPTLLGRQKAVAPRESARAAPGLQPDQGGATGGDGPAPRLLPSRDRGYFILMVKPSGPRFRDTPAWLALRSMTTPLSFLASKPFTPPAMAMPIPAAT